MTGITKDEVTRMAGEVGMNSLSLIDIGYLASFANVVLERAAERCDSKARLLSNVDCEGAHDRVISARELAYDIRALKINTGD